MTHRAAMRGIAAAALCAVTLCAVASGTSAQPAAPLTFAVISNALTRPADEPAVRQMLDAIGRDRAISFIVYDGNVKGGAEACRDGIYESRRELLDASRVPLVLVLGQHDWADCSLAYAGGYDAVERLDFVRQLFFPDSNSLGQSPLTLARESDVARFRTFRDVVRWQDRGVAFIGLNAPSPNNYYLTAGGRNGEFEDRAVATSFWIEHAAETARRTEMRALVIVFQGDPDFGRYERRERFSWLRFSRSNQPRDGFLELKRSLVKAADTFRGPVIVIHGTEASEPNGFHIDQPLRNDKGLIVTNLTRVAIAFRKPQLQWLEVQTDAHWHPPFRLRVREVRKRDSTDTPAETPMPTSASTVPSMPAIPAIPAMPRNELPEYLPPQPTMPQAASELPPILTPPQSSPPSTLPPLFPDSAPGK